ncbi:hypothetical protein MTO96_002093 [Rhipicephalus appendiculatus]
MAAGKDEELAPEKASSSSLFSEPEPLSLRYTTTKDGSFRARLDTARVANKRAPPPPASPQGCVAPEEEDANLPKPHTTPASQQRRLGATRGRYI